MQRFDKPLAIAFSFKGSIIYIIVVFALETDLLVSSQQMAGMTAHVGKDTCSFSAGESRPLSISTTWRSSNARLCRLGGLEQGLHLIVLEEVLRQTQAAEVRHPCLGIFGPYEGTEMRS